VTNFLAADATRPGVISLYFFGAQGAPVTYFECVRGRAQRLGSKTTPDGSPTLLRDATTWSCDRLTRRFVATAPRPDATQVLGTYSVRTMSCARRLRLSAPRRVARGATLRIRVADSWGIGGIRPTLCVTLPGGARRCSVIAFPRAVAVASRRVRANARGRVRLELRVRDRRVGNAAVAVGVGVERQAALPKVLSTGDSMMQGIDGFLADDLGDGAEVHSDVRPGTSIGKNLDWLRWSASQVRRLHPATTVVAIGPNEGWPQQTPAGARVECCGEPWETELSRRMGIMIATYLRRGRGHVIWLTLPAPRGGRLTPIFDAVNHAILRAGTGVPGVTILRMDQLFSPNGYRDAMRYRGVVVRVREPDGVHLNVAGTAIAATQIAQAIAAWR
jgi:lysophospholipase L1-like esterase